jgi:hypothetical protein
VLAAYAIKGAAILERGVTDFSNWLKEFLRDHPGLKGYDLELRRIYKHSQEILKGAQDATETRIEPKGSVQEHIGTEAQRVSSETGDRNRYERGPQERSPQEKGPAGRDVSLTEPDPGMIRVYHGEGGAEGGGAGGSFFTTDKQRARSYGPNVSYVDIDVDQFREGRRMALKSGQPTNKDVLLSTDLVAKAKPHPHIEQTVHDLDMATGPTLQQSVAKESVDRFDRMGIDEFMKTIQSTKRPLTSIAYNLGRIIRSVDIPHVEQGAQNAADHYNRVFADLEKATDPAEKDRLFKEAHDWGMKGQFFNEAKKFRTAIDQAIKTEAKTPQEFGEIEREVGVGDNSGRELQQAVMGEKQEQLYGEIHPDYREGKMYSFPGPVFDVIDKWIREDVWPLFKQTKHLAEYIWHGIANVFSPSTQASVKGANILFRDKGAAEKFITEATAKLDKFGEITHRMPENERIDFIDRIKRGIRQPNAVLQAAADMMRVWGDKVFDAVAAYKPDLPYLENHFRVLWKVIPGSPEAFKGLVGQLPAADQQEFWNRFSQRKPQRNQQLQDIANKFYRWDLDQTKVEALKRGRGLTEQQMGSKRPWRGTQGWAKRHVLEDMSEGIAMGGVPVTTDPYKMFTMSIQDQMKFVAANRSWEALKALDKVLFVRRGKDAPDGFKRINDTIAKAYFRTPQGLMTSTGEWWVDGGEARMINNYLSRDYVRSNPLGRAALSIKNVTTAIELGWSPFHAVFETAEAMGSRFGLGMSQIIEGRRPIEGFRNIAEGLLLEPLGALQESGPWQPFMRKLGLKPSKGTTVRLGEAAIRYARNREEFRAQDPETYDWFVRKYPSAEGLLNLAYTGGLQMGMHADYRHLAQRGMEAAWKSGNYIGAGWRLPFAVSNVMMKPLFETYIPRLKMGTFLREMSFELERNSDKIARGEVTQDQLARKTAAFVEDRFGELNWDNLYWNRTFKSAMQIVFRSVTWKLGNIRGFGKAGRDITLQAARLLTGKRPQITMPMAWLLGMSVVTGMLSSIITKVATGKYPWELAKSGGELMRNLIFPRIDPADASQRVSVPTYWRDLVHATYHPVDYVRSSMTGEIGRMTDLWENKDFYGVEVFHPDDPVYKQVGDALTHLFPLPFGASSYIAARETGASGARAAAGFMGFTKAPYYISYTPAEKKAFELIRSQMPVGSRTREEFQRGVNERVAVDAMRRGDMNLQQAIKEGLVTPQRMERVMQRSRETPLQHAVKSIHAEDAVRILQLATDSEKREIGPYVMVKIANSQLLTSQRRRELLQQVRALLAGQTQTPASTAPTEYAPAP